MGVIFNGDQERLDRSIVSVLEQEEACIIDQIRGTDKSGFFSTNYFAIKYNPITSDEKPAIIDKTKNIYGQIHMADKKIIISSLENHPEGFNIFFDADKVRHFQFYYEGSVISALDEFKQSGYELHLARRPISIEEHLEFSKQKIPHNERYVLIHSDIDPSQIQNSLQNL